jgi:hypothetical protein
MCEMSEHLPRFSELLIEWLELRRWEENFEGSSGYKANYRRMAELERAMDNLVHGRASGN